MASSAVEASPVVADSLVVEASSVEVDSRIVAHHLPMAR